ncbi:MAG: hypothetical protein HWE22_15220 [Flavobacteriales bacterium]|nr:hypothetical protein [Flavobacteriales bacterium]
MRLEGGIFNDFICSGDDLDIIATVQISKDSDGNHSYSGLLLENRIPVHLLGLLDEFHELSNSMSFSLVEPILEEIAKYKLRLKYSGLEIFDLLIEGNSISFVTTEPSIG